MQHESEGAPMADRQTDDFKLGNKAADMWLYTADACANEKVIPKKYRYTTGTALMNGAEAICSCIMELPCTSSPCGESRGPSSKEAISRRPWT